MLELRNDFRGRIYYEQLAGRLRGLSQTVLLQYMAQRRTTVALHTLRYFRNSMYNNEAKDEDKQMLVYMTDVVWLL